MNQPADVEAPAKWKPSPLVLIIAGILALSALFLVLPSNQTARKTLALKRLRNEFIGPKDISELYAGYLVSIKNKVVKVTAADIGQLCVFMPTPTESVSSNFFNELDDRYYSDESRKPIAACLLAPDPSSIGWTLFAKVWIGSTLLKKNDQIAEQYGQMLSYSNAQAMKELTKLWSAFPAEIQSQAEDILVKNREIVKGHKKSTRYYQDGDKTIYEVDISSNIWELKSLLREAYPNRRLVQ
ncbi:MAG: hypothetical protein WCG75_03010 [Armatimonadota bacterium]